MENCTPDYLLKLLENPMVEHKILTILQKNQLQCATDNNENSFNPSEHEELSSLREENRKLLQKVGDLRKQNQAFEQEHSVILRKGKAYIKEIGTLKSELADLQEQNQIQVLQMTQWNTLLQDAHETIELLNKKIESLSSS